MEYFDTENLSYNNKLRSKKWLFFIAAGVLFFLVLGAFFYKASNVLTIMGGERLNRDVYANFEAEYDNNRLDILILGIRGEGDENGGLLADTIMLASFDKRNKQAAVISLPRDLLVEMPNYPNLEKLNFAYALGEQRERGGGLDLSRQVVEFISGVYVDYVVAINFDGFERVVDILGGVQIHRDTDFIESAQWRGEGREDSKFWYKEIIAQEEDASTDQSANLSADLPAEASAEEEDSESLEALAQGAEYWVFYVPKGTHVLDGKDALYYVRSRFSTSDFDRMKRQQEVISSLKASALSLGVLANPFKLFDILDTLGRNVRTDAKLADIRQAISLAQKYSAVEVNSKLLDNSENGLLYDDFVNSQYVLIPKAGDFSEIREFFKNIFND